jgi:hypothetical protein
MPKKSLKIIPSQDIELLQDLRYKILDYGVEKLYEELSAELDPSLLPKDAHNFRRSLDNYSQGLGPLKSFPVLRRTLDLISYPVSKLFSSNYTEEESSYIKVNRNQIQSWITQASDASARKLADQMKNDGQPRIMHRQRFESIRYITGCTYNILNHYSLYIDSTVWLLFHAHSLKYPALFEHDSIRKRGANKRGEPLINKVLHYSLVNQQDKQFSLWTLFAYNIFALSQLTYLIDSRNGIQIRPMNNKEFKYNVQILCDEKQRFKNSLRKLTKEVNDFIPDDSYKEYSARDNFKKIRISDLQEITKSINSILIEVLQQFSFPKLESDNKHNNVHLFYAYFHPSETLRRKFADHIFNPLQNVVPIHEKTLRDIDNLRTHFIRIREEMKHPLQIYIGARNYRSESNEQHDLYFESICSLLEEITEIKEENSHRRITLILSPEMHDITSAELEDIEGLEIRSESSDRMATIYWKDKYSAFSNKTDSFFPNLEKIGLNITFRDLYYTPEFSDDFLKYETVEFPTFLFDCPTRNVRFINCKPQNPVYLGHPVFFWSFADSHL